MFVMLKANWPGNFRRTILGKPKKKGQKGEQARVIEFSPGKPVEVTDAEYEFLVANGDLGSALVDAAFDAKGRAREPDHPAAVSDEPPKADATPESGGDTGSE